MFLALFYCKLYFVNFSSWTKRKRAVLIAVGLFFPILHVLFSKLVFLLIFEPSRSFGADILRQFSKKWFQNIFIGLGLFFLFDYAKAYFLRTYRPIGRTGLQTKGGPDQLWVKEGRSKYQLFPNEIVWVESAKNYVVLCTQAGEQRVIRKTITSMNDVLEPYNFVRVSRSALVNKDYVQVIKKRTKYSFSVITRSGKAFPIGRTYLKNVLSRIDP